MAIWSAYRSAVIPIRDLLHVPVSINIAEILEYLEDADFEDWLTAGLFEGMENSRLNLPKCRALQAGLT
jgi:hypothetical protein